MVKRFLEVGKIINTHGTHGEVKVEPWADSPEYLCSLDSVYLDEAHAFRILKARVQKNNVIMKLEGVDTIEDAEKLKNRILHIDRDEAPIPEGKVFLEDLIGMDAVCESDGSVLGKITNILDLPAGYVYEIHGDKNYLVPDQGGFVRKIDMDHRIMVIRLVEGMEY